MTELANAMRERFQKEWNIARFRGAQADLTKAIKGGDEQIISKAQKRLDKITNNTEPVLRLIEYTGKDSNDNVIVPKRGRDTWANVMLQPYVRQCGNDWAREALIITQTTDVSKCFNSAHNK